MFEPACRGGSKRSLNISNPTPKWPRSPGEMVSAPARAADTHTRTHALALTLTHTWTHAHAAGPRAHRPAVAAAAAAESPLAFLTRQFFFLFNFQFAFAGLPPPAPGKANTSLRRIFPELLGPPGGRREGTPALFLCPSLSRERSPGPAEPWLGPGCPAGLGVRAEAGRRLTARSSTRSPAGARGPGLASAALALLPSGRKFTLCSGLNLELWGSSQRRAPPGSPTLPPLLGSARGNGVPLGVQSCKKMGTCVRALAPDMLGWRPGWRELFAASCSPGRLREDGGKVSGSLYPSLPPHLFCQYMHSPPHPRQPPSNL